MGCGKKKNQKNFHRVKHPKSTTANANNIATCWRITKNTPINPPINRRKTKENPPTRMKARRKNYRRKAASLRRNLAPQRKDDNCCMAQLDLLTMTTEMNIDHGKRISDWNLTILAPHMRLTKKTQPPLIWKKQQQKKKTKQIKERKIIKIPANRWRRWNEATKNNNNQRQWN